MDPPDPEPEDARDLEGDPTERASPASGIEKGDDDTGADWLEEVVARLEDDPDERRAAIESLSAVDEETRLQVIAALAEHRERPAIRELLRLLGSEHDPVVRAAAGLAVRHDHDSRINGGPASESGVGAVGSDPAECKASLPVILADRGGRHLAAEWNRSPTGSSVRW